MWLMMLLAILLIPRHVPEEPAEDEKLLANINQYRKLAKLPKLQISPALERAAHSHNEYQRAYNQKYQRLATIDAKGRGPLGMARQSGYRGDAATIIVLGCHQKKWASITLRTLTMFPQYRDKITDKKWRLIGIDVVSVPREPKPIWFVCILLGE